MLYQLYVFWFVTPMNSKKDSYKKNQQTTKQKEEKWKKKP
jgi:hypothetical protein